MNDRLADNSIQFEILKSGVEAWNSWRNQNPHIKPDLSNSDLSDMDLTDVNLGEANLSGSDFFQTNLTRANLKMSNLSDCDFSGANFKNASLYKANLSNSTFIQVDFSNADLRNVDFTNSDLRGTNFSSSQLCEAIFYGSDLKEANLSNSDLMAAKIIRANLSHANLSSANLRGVKYGSYKMMRGKYYGIHGLDSCFGNALFVRDAQDQDYLDTLEMEINATDSGIAKSMKKFAFFIWSLFDYGRSLLKVCLFALIIAAFFSAIYTLDLILGWEIIDYSSSARSWFTPFYYSIVTYSTLGFGDITPNHWIGELIVVIEVILGYVTLGLLLSILANKVARRS
jgi:hypothetical protein